MDERTRLACDSYRAWTRRTALKGGLAAATAVVLGPSALAQIAATGVDDGRPILVVLFLRGGVDGLNVVVPYGDDDYYRLRPSLALPRPGSGSRSAPVSDLDGFFGMHPSLSPLVPKFKDGELAVVHAIGSDDQTRSHFEAMAAMERGLPRMRDGASRANGWLARYLNATASEGDSPLRAVAISDVMPDSVRGAIGATNIREVGDFRVEGTPEFRRELVAAYAKSKDEIGRAGRDALSVLDTLDRLDYRSYRAQGSYPSSSLGQGLRQVAFLAKAGIGLEVAFLDMDGWDTHVAQGSTTGWQASLIDDMAKSIAVFLNDLGSVRSRVTFVAMTEFGRRAYENSALGTDHGRGSVMFVAGAGVRGGRVYGTWPGLSKDKLVGPGDLEVTTDYRNVLAELLEKRMRLRDASAVFPGLDRRAVGVFS